MAVSLYDLMLIPAALAAAVVFWVVRRRSIGVRLVLPLVSFGIVAEAIYYGILLDLDAPPKESPIYDPRGQEHVDPGGTVTRCDRACSVGESCYHFSSAGEEVNSCRRPCVSDSSCAIGWSCNLVESSGLAKDARFPTDTCIEPEFDDRERPLSGAPLQPKNP